MKPRTKRALAIVGGLATLAVATTLVLNAFQSNLVFFFSPSQVASMREPLVTTFVSAPCALAVASSSGSRG